MMNGAGRFRRPGESRQPEEFTIRELAELVIELTGSKSQAGLRSRCRPTTPRSASPTSRWPERRLGWQPTVRFATGWRRRSTGSARSTSRVPPAHACSLTHDSEHDSSGDAPVDRRRRRPSAIDRPDTAAGGTGLARLLRCPNGVHAIRRLQVRGVPAIGIAAAYGVCLGLQEVVGGSEADFFARLDQTCEHLATSRPTAVNLFWALDRMQAQPTCCAARSQRRRLPSICWPKLGRSMKKTGRCAGRSADMAPRCSPRIKGC